MVFRTHVTHVLEPHWVWQEKGMRVVLLSPPSHCPLPESGSREKGGDWLIEAAKICEEPWSPWQEVPGGSPGS